MIRMARDMDKVVITATQMMESMITNPVPTRAKSATWPMPYLDGTDAVMLSAETAAGRYPLETVQEMAKICAAAEAAEDAQLDADFTGRTFPVSISPSPWVRCSLRTTWVPRPSSP